MLYFVCLALILSSGFIYGQLLPTEDVVGCWIRGMVTSIFNWFFGIVILFFLWVSRKFEGTANGNEVIPANGNAVVQLNKAGVPPNEAAVLAAENEAADEAVVPAEGDLLSPGTVRRSSLCHRVA